MQTTVKRRVAVVGAGIAGLSCATHLQALGFEVESLKRVVDPVVALVQDKPRDGRRTMALNILQRAIPFLSMRLTLGLLTAL